MSDPCVPCAGHHGSDSPGDWVHTASSRRSIAATALVASSLCLVALASTSWSSGSGASATMLGSRVELKGRSEVSQSLASRLTEEAAALAARQDRRMKAIENQLLNRGDVFKKVDESQHSAEKLERENLLDQDRREEIKQLAEMQAQARRKHQLAHRAADAQLQRYSDIYNSHGPGDLATSNLEDDYAVPSDRSTVADELARPGLSSNARMPSTAEPPLPSAAEPPLPSIAEPPLQGLAIQAENELQGVQNQLKQDALAKSAGDQATELSDILKGTIVQLQGLVQQGWQPPAQTLASGISAAATPVAVPVSQVPATQNDGMPTMASMLQKFKAWKAAKAAGTLQARQIQPMPARPPAIMNTGPTHWATLGTAPEVQQLQKVTRPTACAMIVSSYRGQTAEMEGACHNTVGCQFDFGQQTCLDARAAM